MNQERKQLLIKALKSGNYEKGRGRLQSTRNRFCCLGVGCSVYQKETGLGMWLNPKKTVYSSYKNKTFCSPNDGDSMRLPEDVRNWFGLTPTQEDTLIEINDKSGSFEPVIKALEKM